jgi:hypothetical protein
MSVVTKAPCAIKFGSKQNRANANNAAVWPYISNAARKIVIASIALREWPLDAPGLKFDQCHWPLKSVGQAQSLIF